MGSGLSKQKEDNISWHIKKNCSLLVYSICFRTEVHLMVYCMNSDVHEIQTLLLSSMLVYLKSFKENEPFSAG